MAPQDLGTLQELREHRQGGLIGGVDCDVNVAFGGPCTSTGEKALFSPVKSSGDAGVAGCSREKKQWLRSRSGANRTTKKQRESLLCCRQTP